MIIRERIEGGIRNGKIALGLNLVANLNQHSPGYGKNKARIGNTHLIVYPQKLQCDESNQAIGKGNYNRDKKVVNFTPIPMNYTKLLLDLLYNNLIEVCPTMHVRPPYPKNYDVNSRCDYHAGASGHSTEACRALKRKVRSFIDLRRLIFHEGHLDVEGNPLPWHGNTPIRRTP